MVDFSFVCKKQMGVLRAGPRVLGAHELEQGDGHCGQLVAGGGCASAWLCVGSSV